jgi:hypothetical protein
MDLDALGLPDETVFVEIPRRTKLRCSVCGSRKVRVMPKWPLVNGMWAHGAKKYGA